MIEIVRSYIADLYAHVGMSQQYTYIYSVVTIVLLLGGLCVSLYTLLHKFATPMINRLVRRTETMWDDYLFDTSVLSLLWKLVSWVIFYNFIPDFSQCEVGYTIVQQGLKIVIALYALKWFIAILDKITHYTTEQEKAQHQTLIGIVQFVKLIAYFIFAIIVVALLFGKSPLNLIAGLGAAATVLMLVFRDSILGLVAGIQLSANQMLKPGDWVAIEKLNIDGVVQKVSLTTVKIKNFDNTISTVPPYTLVSDSFRNWENVFTVGARQVKRSFYIDVNSVRHLTKGELTLLHQQGMVTDSEASATAPQVNLTLFRNHCRRLLSEHTEVNKAHWIVVRLLQSTPNGLPMELYFYLSDTAWERYENNAAILQEQIIATMPQFGLRIFQNPSGADLQNLLLGKSSVGQA